MSFDTLWFFTWDDFFLGFSELLNESLVLAVNTVSESSLLSDGIMRATDVMIGGKRVLI